MMNIGLNMTWLSYFPATNFRRRFSSLPLSSHSHARALFSSLLRFFHCSCLQCLTGVFQLPLLAVRCGRLERVLGVPSAVTNFLIHATRLSPRKIGPIGDICKDFVRGGTCICQRHAIGRDGSLRRFWLGARRNFFANFDPEFNFNALSCAYSGDAPG